MFIGTISDHLVCIDASEAFEKAFGHVMVQRPAIFLGAISFFHFYMYFQNTPRAYGLCVLRPEEEGDWQKTNGGGGQSAQRHVLNVLLRRSDTTASVAGAIINGGTSSTHRSTNDNTNLALFLGGTLYIRSSGV